MSAADDNDNYGSIDNGQCGRTISVTCPQTLSNHVEPSLTELPHDKASCQEEELRV